ncbi:MAG: hypothetical protein DWQ42_08300 [Planctomycetota bacterium]|nr:MAG: hypothetical protein DWQ42_08300 [Planctomycetota bacterium]
MKCDSPVRLRKSADIQFFGNKTLEYDGKGNATKVPWLFSWPPSAAPRGDLTWDFDNQLKNYTLTVGPTTIDIDFRYDALGRRVSRDTNSYFGSEYYHRGDKVYVCDGDQVIAEYKPQTEGADAMHKYVYGTYVDEVCVFIDRVEPLASTLGSEEFRYYHRNNQYSVVALTDDTSTGVILERYTYNSYGVPMRLDPDGTLHGAKWYYSDVGNQYLFTGRRWDSWLGVSVR